MIDQRNFKCAQILEHIISCSRFEHLSLFDNDNSYSQIIECTCGLRWENACFVNTSLIGQDPFLYRKKDKIYREQIDTIFFYMLENGDITQENWEMVNNLLINPYMKIRSEENYLLSKSMFQPSETNNPKLKDAIFSMEI